MSETNKDNSVRLNKHLALVLGLSRREADEHIASGRVSINGSLAVLGARIAPTDQIYVDGKEISLNNIEKKYILFHKPVGYVCSRRTQGDAPTIYSLLPKDFFRLKPVGRLDKDSSGLLLMSNDGDFSHQMTHPSFYKQKTYLVSLDHDLEPLHQQMINDFGVQLEDGSSQLTLQRQSDDNRKDWIVLMHEGRNRQIRRTFAALGYTVVKLHRTIFGNYSLGDIKPSEWQEIDIS